MPDTQFMTLEAAATKATREKTALALSKLRLAKAPFVPTVNSTVLEFEAAEADADGYTPGGYTLTAWAGPVAGATGGAVITSPITNVAYGPPSDPPVGNSITAWWIETAAGDLALCGGFDPPRSLAAALDGWPMVVRDTEGRNAVPV